MAARERPALRTEAADETEMLGRRLGALLHTGDVVALSGDLGAGKTVMVRGIAAGAGSAARVASPTFTLIREYPGPVPLFHVDLYRIDDSSQLEDLGLEELFDRPAVMVVEWAERAGALLPPEHLWVSLAFGVEADEREITFAARGRRYEEILERLIGEGAGGKDRRK
jgi:tRNA threonylcarbamoyladenosine biosynthesis protein TsaE